jgi:hypothetical protein
MGLSGGIGTATLSRIAPDPGQPPTGLTPTPEIACRRGLARCPGVRDRP